ncbi:hypothetical protein ES702_06455 [subsurface metagenome]
MDQNEFERHKAAQIRALNAMDEKPMIKVIDLVELLLKENPSLPVVIQVGTRKMPITSVLADDENNVQLKV